MSRSSGGISLATIIFWAILASTFLFDDDDDDKKAIDIKTDIEVVTTSKEDELKNHLTEAAKLAKESLTEVKDKTIEIIDEYREEKIKEQEEEVDQAHNNKTIETETIEKEKEDLVKKGDLKPLEENNNQKIEGMKKL
jgi:hypothetical protein